MEFVLANGAESTPSSTLARTGRRNTLVFAAPLLDQLRCTLLRSAPAETAAFVLARAAALPGGGWRLVAYDVMYIGDDEYSVRTPTAIELPPEIVARTMQRARTESASVVFVHSHPGAVGQGAPLPSSRDLAGEALLVPALRRRIPGVPHARLIIGADAIHGALFGPLGNGAPDGEVAQPLSVIEVGHDVAFPTSESSNPDRSHDHFDRQIRAFGGEGQARLAGIRVGIVGLGGTGSVVAQQLAHLGVGAMLLIDPDEIESTNLNRVVGAHRADCGRPKVDVARDMILCINPDAVVSTMQSDIRDADIARHLLDVDFFFGCTDSQGSRAVLAQLAYQYLVPGIDVGVAINATERGVSHVSGRVQMLAPGLACLLCSGVLDPEAVRRDLLTDEARAADQYIMGADVAQPSVISLNSAAASLAIYMFLSALTGMPMSSRNQRLRFEAGKVASIETAPAATCPWCSAQGGFLRADSWPAPGRVVQRASAALHRGSSRAVAEE